MFLSLVATSAFALTCDEITGLVSAGVSTELVVQTLRASAPPPSAADIECLVASGMAQPIIDAAYDLAGIPVPKRSGPSPEDVPRTRGHTDPTERRFGNWSVMALDGDLMASTAATNEKTMMVVVTCNEGLFNITAFNTALLMIGAPYRTSVSYDDGPYMPVPDDAHFPIEHLAFILRSSKMNVRWTLAEGTVGGKFSLRGSTAALDHVMAACAVEEPRSPSPPSR